MNGVVVSKNVLEGAKKFCTDPEQSKRLQEIGLDPATADFMWGYWYNGTNYAVPRNIPTFLSPSGGLAPGYSPAWSYQALADLCNGDICVKGEVWHLNFERLCGRYNLQYRRYDRDCFLPRKIFMAESWSSVDVVCDAVCWLLRNGIGLNQKGAVCCDRQCSLCKTEKCQHRKEEYKPSK